MISIVDADPDLGDLLAPGELERARREALTRVGGCRRARGTPPRRTSPPSTIAGS